MWASGRLVDTSADRVLLLLAARSSTGTLTVQGDDVLAVRFRAGEIIGADALRESLTHGLGRFLVAAGHLNRDQVAALESTELDGSVIDHLLRNEMVPPETLAGCVRQHTYLLLVRLLGWKRGDYQFYDGEVASALEVRPLSVEELLVRASEEDPRLLGITVAPLGTEVLKPLLPLRGFRVLSWQQAPSELRPDELWLTPFEDALLRSLDGLTPAVDFKERLGVDDFRLRLALHRLNDAGLVESVLPAAPAVRDALAEPPEARRRAEPPEARRRAEPAAAVTASPVAASVVAPPIAEVAESATTRGARLVETGALLSDLSRAFSYVLAAGLAILMIVLVIAGGSVPRLHHPFPWQEADRQLLESVRVATVHRDLSGRLKTYHILYGTFPLDLRPLVDTGIVDARDLEHSDGRAVAFEALENGYLLGVESPDGETLVGLRSRFSATGDFLLDPAFTRVEGELPESPVQLLD